MPGDTCVLVKHNASLIIANKLLTSPRQCVCWNCGGTCKKCPLFFNLFYSVNSCFTNGVMGIWERRKTCTTGPNLAKPCQVEEAAKTLVNQMLIKDAEVKQNYYDFFRLSAIITKPAEHKGMKYLYWHCTMKLSAVSQCNSKWGLVKYILKYKSTLKAKDKHIQSTNIDKTRHLKLWTCQHGYPCKC